MAQYLQRERERERERDDAQDIKRNPPRFFNGHTLTFYRIFRTARNIFTGNAAVFLLPRTSGAHSRTFGAYSRDVGRRISDFISLVVFFNLIYNRPERGKNKKENE
jgi:hypothetical protein